jgi:hypothetical protein
LREPPGGAKRAKHRAKHEHTVLRSKNKGTKCTFVVSEPQHQLWVQWGMWRPERSEGHAQLLNNQLVSGYQFEGNASVYFFVFVGGIG